MILVADIGNTNCLFGVFDGDQLVKTWRHDTKTPLDAIPGLEGPFEGAILASVVPDLNDTYLAAMANATGQTPLLVGNTEVDLGIEILIDEPDKVGADRVLNAIAAKEAFGAPLIVIDFGTATTFDVVGQDGAYLGGVICPGVNLSIDALHRGTAKLPHVEVTAPEAVTGKNTKDAIQSGIFHGYLGLIEGIVAKLQNEHGGGLQTVATGGLAPLFAAKTKAIQHEVPDLTLQGLRLVYEQNRA